MSNTEDNSVPTEEAQTSPARNVFSRDMMTSGTTATIAIQVAIVVGLLFMGGVLALLGERLLGGNVEESRMSQYQAWSLICPPRTQPISCKLTQSVNRESGTGSLALLSAESEGDRMQMRIVVPLGVLLQAGVGFSVGDVLTQVRPYETCDPSGCMALVMLDATVLSAMTSKDMGEVGISVPTSEQPFSVPYSLAGFKEGYAALVKANAQRNSVFSFLYR